MSTPLTPVPGRPSEFLRGPMIKALVLVLSGVCTPAQAAATTYLLPSELLEALNDPETVKTVQAEILHLRLSGRLAALKAAVLTERMVDRLLAMDPEDVNPTLVAKLAELGAKLRPTTPESLGPAERLEREREGDERVRNIWARQWPHLFPSTQIRSQ